MFTAGAIFTSKFMTTYTATNLGGALSQEAAPENNNMSKTTREVLGAHLALVRQRKGWSQKTAAEAAKLNERTLKGIELGYANPNLVTLEQLADGYGITLAAMFEPWQQGSHEADSQLLYKKLVDLMGDPTLGQVLRTLINAMHRQMKKE